jgi:imidazolonepropionase-like amidohydrolase
MAPPAGHATIAQAVLFAMATGTAAVAVGGLPRGAAVPAAAADAVAIIGVTVIDVASGREDRDVTVVTRGPTIAASGRHVPIPADAVRVQGRGKYLIPGLWDMHAHNQANGPESLDLYLANGVVGARDMGSDVGFILPLRDRINRGEVRGPEIVAAGPILDNRPPDWPFRRHITNAREARQAVRELKASGVDFIKVHDATPRDAFFAIADEAPRLGLPFAGHVPNDVAVEEAIDAGIRSIEHLANFRVFTGCSGGGAYNAAACRDRFAAMATRGVWQTPTLAFFHAIPDLFSGQPMAHAEYASDTLREMTRKNAAASHIDPQGLSAMRAMGETSLRAVRDLVAAGNRLLAGCDGLVPGFCLADELEFMTRAGLSPLQALQAATINPARYFGRENTQGTIAIGKRADLVLLDADPLADIGNTRRIAAVVVRGRLIARTEIDRLLAAHRRPAAAR